MNPLLKLILKGGGALGVPASMSFFGPQIPSEKLFNQFQDQFDPTGANATRNRTILDLISTALGEGAGIDIGESERPNPIRDQFLAGMSMAGYGQGARLTPDQYKGAETMRRGALDQMAVERMLDAEARRQYLATDKTWKAIESGLSKQVADLNRAADAWKQLKKSQGVTPTVKQIADFRRNWLSGKPNYADILRGRGFGRPTTGMPENYPMKWESTFANAEKLPEGEIYGWGGRPIPPYIR